MRSAFADIDPDDELVRKISRQINIHSPASKPSFMKNILSIRAHWKGWAAAISAAAAMVLLVPAIIYLSSPSSAVAAQAELIKIHEHNLSQNHNFHSESEPEKLAEYFKDKLGFNPRLPEPGQGLALRGCCVRHFQGRIVGSYVVDTPDGIMSVVVVTDKPESLGMAGTFKKDGQTYWKSSFAKCDMVTVRIGDYSYCAVGEISHKYLTALLSRLLSEEGQK